MELQTHHKNAVDKTAGLNTPTVYYGRTEPIPIIQLKENLPESELENARKFSHPADAHAYLRVRWITRGILSRQLGIHPKKIIFQYTKTGKPFLPGTDLSFNLSHAQNVFVIALSKGSRIGADVEWLARQTDVLKTHKLVFSPAEQILLNHCDPPEKKRHLIDAWTKKEALLKAVGCGLSRPMNELNVLQGHEFQEQSSFAVKLDEAQWKLESRTIFGQYRLSVAIEQPNNDEVNLTYLAR